MDKEPYVPVTKGLHRNRKKPPTMVELELHQKRLKLRSEQSPEERADERARKAYLRKRKTMTLEEVLAENNKKEGK